MEHPVFCWKGTKPLEELAAASFRYKISNVDKRDPKGVGC
jgi:hypothetical protein